MSVCNKDQEPKRDFTGSLAQQSDASNSGSGANEDIVTPRQENTRSLPRLAIVFVVALVSVFVFIACASRGDLLQPTTSSQGASDGGITREEAEERGVNAAPGDARIAQIDAAEGATEVRVSVTNVSDTADTYAIIIASRTERLGIQSQVIAGGETVEVVIALEAPLTAGSALQIRVDGELLGEGVALKEIEVR